MDYNFSYFNNSNDWFYDFNGSLYDENYYPNYQNDVNEEYSHVRKPFSTQSTIALCGIVTNAILLAVLLIRLVNDIRNKNSESARGQKRHVLIILCFDHVLYLSLKISVWETDSLNAWFNHTVSACRATMTFLMSYETLSRFYSAMLGFVILAYVFRPALLVGKKQFQVWLIINVLMCSFVFIGHSVFTVTTYELLTLPHFNGEKISCINFASQKTWIWYMSSLQVLPICMLLLSTIITGLVYVLKTIRTIPINSNTGNNRMLDRVSRTQFQAVVFLIVFALFTSGTCLPYSVVHLKLIINRDPVRDHDSLMFMLKVVSLLNELIYRLLFPACCLILDETWLFQAIDKCARKRETPTPDRVVENIELDDKGQTQQGLTHSGP